MINFFSELTTHALCTIKCDIRGKGKIEQTSIDSLLRATFVTEWTLSLKLKPYNHFTSHAKSFLHPFAHLAQLGINMARAAYDVCIFAAALLSFNGSGAVQAFSALCDLTIASLIEVTNIASSILTFTTRTLASVYNKGYQALPEEQQDHKTNEDDENIHNAAFTFV